MSLKALSKIPRTFGFRMMLWYSALFTISYFCVFSVAFWSLSSSLRKQDRILIESKMKEYAALFQKSGLESLRETADAENFFVRVADVKNQTLFQQIARDMLDDDTHTLVFSPNDFQKDTRNQSWAIFHAVDDEEDLLEIASTVLPDGKLLQVGRTNEVRDDALDQFLNLFVVVFLVLVLIGFIAGALLTYRVLHPVREVIGAARSIVNTGKMEARVSTAHSTGEIQELVVLFNNMLDKIEILIQGMKGSLDNVAHDLRTPVSRMRAAAENALQANNGVTGYREALADCLEESDRVMTMLNTLMDISEAETGAMKLDLKEWKVALLLKDIVDLYSYIADEKGISVYTGCPEELTLQVDRNRFQQAVANLLDNAIKYSPAGGEVQVKAYSESDKVIVLVQDHGIGIPSDDLDKVWDRLYRGDKSRTQRGLGLGLSFVKAIVEAHHGSVTVNSRPQEGSVFAISLPRS